MGCLLEMIAKKNTNGKANFIRLEKKNTPSSNNKNKIKPTSIKNKSQKKIQITSEE